jgi:hypothetical protein
MTQTIQPTQEACQVVRSEFGGLAGDIDMALFRDPELHDVADEIAENLARNPNYTRTHDQRDLQGGKGAIRAIGSLGCASCELARVCVIKSGLQELATEGEGARRREMLASSPRWLAAGRLNLAGVDAKTARSFLESPDALDELMNSGKTLDDLLGEAINRFEGSYRKQDLPELEGIKASSLKSSGAEPFGAHLVETEVGKFIVMDASRPNQNEDLKEYFILCGKLLKKMSEKDVDGQPQIMNEDQKIQKAIRRMGTGTLYEMRMAGKNRLYFVLLPDPSPDDPNEITARITIVGNHNGDAATQQRFINSLLIDH